MHGQRGFVGPKQRLIGIRQDHAVGQAGDDLLQVAAVGFAGQDGWVHVLSARQKGSGL